MLIAMPLCSSDPPLLERKEALEALLVLVSSVGAGNESGTPPLGMEEAVRYEREYPPDLYHIGLRPSNGVCYAQF